MDENKKEIVEAEIKSAEPAEAKETVETALPEESVKASKNKKEKVDNLIKKIKDAFSPEKRKKSIAILAVIVAILAVGAGVISHSSPKSVAERFVVASIYNDADAMNSMLAYNYHDSLISSYKDEEDFFDAKSNELKEDITSWKDYSKVLKNLRTETLEDDYGKFKLTEEATRVKDLSKKKMEDELGSSYMKFLEKYDFDMAKVSKCKEVTVKLKLTGEDDNLKLIYTIDMAKIGGSWKILTWDVDY